MPDDPQDASALHAFVAALPNAHASAEVLEAPSSASILDVLVFATHGQHYGIEGTFVREILGSPPITSLPGSPPFLNGVVLYKRHVVGVLNIAAWLYPNQKWAHEPPDRVILIEHGALTVGIHAGQDVRLERWDMDTLQHEAGRLAPNVRKYCSGIQEHGTHNALLLNIPHILRDATREQ